MSFEVTVAICTRDNEASLLETLRSVAAQDWDGTWEVLVVDNANADGTTTAVQKRVADFPAPLRVEQAPEPGLAGARNVALKAARGRAVLFIDDDVTCDAGWLAAHGAAFRQADVAGTGGPIRPSMPGDTPQWFLDILEREVGGPTSRYDFGSEPLEIEAGGPVPPPFGANMAMLRKRAVAANGFRTDLGWGKRMIPSEELEFFRRYRTLGGHLLYLPDASLVHRIAQHRTTREYYLRWQEAFGRSEVYMDPPNGMLACLGRVGRQSWRVRKWSRIARRARRREGEAREMLALRVRERHRGSLLELLRWGFRREEL